MSGERLLLFVEVHTRSVPHIFHARCWAFDAAGVNISHKLQQRVAWPFIVQTWRTLIFKSIFHKMEVQTLISYLVLLNGSTLLSPCGFDHLSAHPGHSQISGKFLQAQNLNLWHLIGFGGVFFFFQILSTYAEICVCNQKGKRLTHVPELTNILNFFPFFILCLPRGFDVQEKIALLNSDSLSQNTFLGFNFNKMYCKTHKFLIFGFKKIQNQQGFPACSEPLNSTVQSF